MTNEQLIKELKEALQWFIDNDDTNEGDVPIPEYDGRTWNEINDYWIAGLDRARALIKEPAEHEGWRGPG